MTAKADFGPRLGADPEMFVQDLVGKPVPVCGKVGGTKEKPIIVDNEIAALWGRARKDANSMGSYAVQEDNVMLEVNVPASMTSTAFTQSVERMLGWLQSGFLTEKGLALRLKTSHQSFATDVLAKYPQALTVGCLPDMYAYADTSAGERVERMPFEAKDFGNDRFCGGHLHLQYNKENAPPHIMAKFMDVVVGLPFLSWDKQGKRRPFYGQPGLFRIKPYGIEYRTPSNYWLKKEFVESRLGILAENALNLGYTANNSPSILRDMYAKIRWEDVKETIVKEDTKAAAELIGDIRRTFPGMYIGM